MMSRTTFALLAVAAVFAGCIEANRPVAQDTVTGGDTLVEDADTQVPVDTSAADTTQVACDGDAQCAALVIDSCKTATCVNHACVFTNVEDDTPCGDAGACSGAQWTAPETCQDGACVKPAPVVCASLPGGCTDTVCDADVGCKSTPKDQGTECVAGGGALLCEEGVWHPQDHCDAAGNCVEAAPEACEAGFCQVAVCDPQQGCGVQDVGVADGAAGDWRFVYLRFVPDATLVGREVFSARGTLTLDGDGEWHRGAVEASAVGAMPAVTVSSFCVGEDGGLALAMGMDGEEPNAVIGQLTPERDLLFAVSYLRPELFVAVKAPTGTVPTEATAARYRMLGVVKKAITSEVYAIDGVLSFGSDGCLDRPATYQRSDQEAVVNIPSAGACLQFAADGTVSFPHEESLSGRVGVPVTLSGFSRLSRDVLVMTIAATDEAVFPSLVMLVRESPNAGLSALEGTYAFGGLTASGDNLDRLGGKLVYDGAGLVTSYDAFLGDLVATGGGGTQDRYTVTTADTQGTGNLAGSYTHDVATGTDRNRRVGHISARVSTGEAAPNLSPVVVVLPVSSTWHIVPGIELAIRRQ